MFQVGKFFGRRPIVIGDRFETRDWRDEGRVVEVTGTESTSGGRVRKYRITNEAHPKNPEANGRSTWIEERTLRRRFRRVSR